MDKLNVLIVDDEYLVRELLKRSVPWDDLKLTIAGEASGAMEAMDLIEEKQPEIVITDICMPIMDGIKLSSIILDKYPQIKIIVLTGHDDFIYARESISLGIKEYLLKPINPEDLKKCLVKISKEILDEKAVLQDMKDVLPLLKEKTLNDLMSVRGLGDDIVENLSRHDIKFKSDKFRVGLIQIISEKDSLYRNRIDVYNTIKNHFSVNEDVYCFQGSRGFIVILSHNRIDLEGFCDRILNNIVNRLNYSMSIGVGREVEGLENISISYDQASKALEYQVIEGLNSVISFDDLEETIGYDSSMHSKIIKELSFSLKAGLDDRFKENIKELFSLQIKGVGGDINSIRVMASNILSVILSLITEQDLDLHSVFVSGIQPYENIFKLVELRDIESYLYTLGEAVILKIKEKNSNKTSRLVSGVKQHLKDNLSDPEIQLSNVAEKFYVNPSYLSRKFKQETGETFMEFLGFLRIEKAVELLKTTDKRSYEIAYDIGINDPHYFSIFFKKKMNISISDYKKQLKVKYGTH